MNLSKQSLFHIDTFVKNLKKKEKQTDDFSKEVAAHFDEMVAIKDYLGTVYNNDNVAVSDRTKIFIEKLKELEVIGEKHDASVKKIKDLKEKIDLEIEVLISSIQTIDRVQSPDDIRNYIFQYIESKR